MTPRALIFDVDGTLADTEEMHRRAFNEAFALHGLDWNWSRPLYAQLLLTAGGKERIGAHVQSLRLPAADSQRLLDMIPALHGTKTELYTRAVSEGEISLRDGVARLLDEAEKAGVALAIASTTSFANIEALLAATLGTNALRRFAAIGSAESAATKKPAPDVYLHVLRELSLPAAHCVAFEDSANGLCAAQAAGLFTVVTPSYWTRTENLHGADLLLPSLGSAQRPLPPLSAEAIGGPYLSLAIIGEQMDKRGQRLRASA